MSELALFAATAVLAGAAVATGRGWLVQGVGVLVLLPGVLADLAAADARRACTHLLAWAGGLTALGMTCGAVFPEALPRVWTDAGWMHDDLVSFLTFGEGFLARPWDYATDHVLDYVYVSIGAAFGVLAPLWWGTRHVLLVAHEWGTLVRSSGTAATVFAGIPPWTWLGALGYAALVVGWGEVTGAVLARRAVRWRAIRAWVGAATGTLALHLLAKIALAQGWRVWLWG